MKRNLSELAGREVRGLITATFSNAYRSKWTRPTEKGVYRSNVLQRKLPSGSIWGFRMRLVTTYFGNYILW